MEASKPVGPFDADNDGRRSTFEDADVGRPQLDHANNNTKVPASAMNRSITARDAFCEASPCAQRMPPQPSAATSTKGRTFKSRFNMLHVNCLSNGYE